MLLTYRKVQFSCGQKVKVTGFECAVTLLFRYCIGVFPVFPINFLDFLCIYKKNTFEKFLIYRCSLHDCFFCGYIAKNKLNLLVNIFLFNPFSFSLSTYILCIQPFLPPGPHPAGRREASLGSHLLLVWMGGEDSQGSDSPQLTLLGEALKQ